MVDNVAIRKWIKNPANLVTLAILLLSAAVIIGVSLTSDNAWHAPETGTCERAR